MPANLTPQYLEAEKRFREAKTQEEKIAALEEMLTVIPKHKGTDKLQADIKRRLSKFKEESQKKKGAAVSKSVFHIEKEGAAQVVVIGPPNTGKSSLINRLTKATPEVADFPHSTHKPTPGMAQYENIQFQLVDTPPVTGEYVDPGLADLIRHADIVVILLDASGDLIEQYEETMESLRRFRILPEGSQPPEEMKKPQFFKKMLIAANKMDAEREQEDFEAFIDLMGPGMPCLGISIREGKNLQEFLDVLYNLSDVIRVYSKNPGKEPDLEEPFVVPKETTLEELAGKIHKDIAKKMKYARIWGKTVHDGQMVQRDYILHDGDIVEIHI